jgi:hypothetical protein
MSFDEKTMDFIPREAGFTNRPSNAGIVSDASFTDVEITKKMFLLTWTSLLDAP